VKFIDRAMVLFLAAIFLFSSLDKVFHYDGFVNALRDYVLVPHGTAPFLAIPVICAELLIGVGLLLPPWRRQAALTAVFVLLAFTAAIGLNKLYGSNGICGCWFTITLAKSSEIHLLQNLLLTALAANIWWEQRRRPPVLSEPSSAAALP
jgi:uncharacterized membrane protein YphA (DoxX/SURF4 family)